ncbi:MAG: exonuclease SbcCD subunit D [Oscillospiraceae bacterium]|nr:exonuclease SbcCD subunit D [Oscillospiraceae bacterium]
MKLLHLSDLHVGKRVHEANLLEDQAYILQKILEIVDAEAPDAVLLAGDLYDRTTPSAEAVALFDEFLCRLAARPTRVLAISGNHDSPERVAFASRLLTARDVYLSPVFDGTIRPVTLSDEFGPARFWLLPFLKPATVRRFYPDRELETWTDALRTVIDALPLDRSERNVLLAHQFITGAVRSESEELSVGGADNVDAEVFAAFDYAALGHLHGPQSVGPNARYCGSPLKYSFSEARQEKSVTVVELGEKGRVEIRTVPLTPLRDLRELRGGFLELCRGPETDDYLRIVLTDEQELPDAFGRLRLSYPNLLKLDYDNRRSRAEGTPEEPGEAERLGPLELFEALYETQNGQPMSEEQRAFSLALMEEIWEGML